MRQAPKRAEDLYRRALKAHPRHAYALYNLAILLEEQAAELGDLQEVRGLFVRAVAAAPTDAMTLADYGRFILVRERNYKLAEEMLERALVADPEYPPACFYMGMLLLNVKKQKVSGGGPESSRVLCRASVLRHPLLPLSLTLGPFASIDRRA